MKKYKIIISVICLIAIIIALPSCGDSPEESETGDVYCTITFNTNGGSPIESIQVKKGHHAHAPETPTLENHVFLRWTLNDRPYFFETKDITEDITLDAKWISADLLFDFEPVGEGLGITKIEQLSFDTLKIPTVINGKTVTAILDEGCIMIHDGHADNLEIPETIVWVGKKAFMGISVTTLDFKGTLTHIDESSFESCETLTTLKLGSGIQYIPFRCFNGCTALKTLDIPEGVSIIQENAFEGCSSMYTVVLPSTLTTIENGAFYGAGIKSVFFKGTEAQFDAVEIADENDCILDANVYFYSEAKPTAEGSFWHYDKSGSPVIW